MRPALSGLWDSGRAGWRKRGWLVPSILLMGDIKAVSVCSSSVCSDRQEECGGGWRPVAFIRGDGAFFFWRRPFFGVEVLELRWEPALVTHDIRASAATTGRWYKRRGVIGLVARSFILGGWLCHISCIPRHVLPGPRVWRGLGFGLTGVTTRNGRSWDEEREGDVARLPYWGNAKRRCVS